MAGASDGSSSLADIRAALVNSRSKIDGAWRTEFLAVSERGAPEKLVCYR